MGSVFAETVIASVVATPVAVVVTTVAQAPDAIALVPIVEAPLAMVCVAVIALFDKAVILPSACTVTEHECVASPHDPAETPLAAMVGLG